MPSEHRDRPLTRVAPRHGQVTMTIDAFTAGRRAVHTDAVGRVGRERERHMLMGVFGAILPRFVLLVGWVNDPNAWTSLFGAPVWFLFVFLFFPWPTLFYGFAALSGMSFINWPFGPAALLSDLGTCGIVRGTTRQQV